MEIDMFPCIVGKLGCDGCVVCKCDAACSPSGRTGRIEDVEDSMIGRITGLRNQAFCLILGWVSDARVGPVAIMVTGVGGVQEGLQVLRVLLPVRFD